MLIETDPLPYAKQSYIGDAEKARILAGYGLAINAPFTRGDGFFVGRVVDVQATYRRDEIRIVVAEDTSHFKDGGGVYRWYHNA